jgi:hypothetical protein
MSSAGILPIVSKNKQRVSHNNRELKRAYADGAHLVQFRAAITTLHGENVVGDSELEKRLASYL